MLWSALAGATPALQNGNNTTSLCELTVFPSIFVSQVRWNVTSWGGGEEGEQLHMVHQRLQYSNSRNYSAGTAPLGSIEE